MLEFNRKLAIEFGQLTVKKYEIKGRSGNYIVEILNNGEMRCNCIAGSMGKDCRHKRILRNKLKGEKYEPKQSKTNTL